MSESSVASGHGEAMKPLVSIVTPSYNQGQFLEATIRSVLSQSYPRIEYIVCDGGSKDNSVTVLERYSERLAWWCSERDRGQSEAINKGWRRSTGQVLAYLNSDDVLLPGAVECAVAVFQRAPKCGVVYGDWEYLGRHGDVLGSGRGRSTSFERLLRDGQSVYIGQPASFYRAETVRGVGLMDESLHYSMDYDLLLRLAKVSDMEYIPLALAGYRVHTSAKTTAFAQRHWQETLAVCARHGAHYFSKQRFKYWRYRAFACVPHGLQMWLRRIRRGAKDWAILASDAERHGESTPQ